MYAGVPDVTSSMCDMPGHDGLDNIMSLACSESQVINAILLQLVLTPVLTLPIVVELKWH